MKILVIQLARLGDIYMTWPVIRALSRRYPDAESIDMLVRPKFSKAVDGLLEVNQVHLIPMEQIFSPLMEDHINFSESLLCLNQFLEKIKKENYTLIINLSFSPASSFITHILASETKTEVLGYNRYEDGFLSIPDDVSAYFYAQVGPGRPNRIHLTDLFCLMVDIDPTNSDWKPPSFEDNLTPPADSYIAIHIGASEQRKSVSTYKWRSIISHFLNFSTLKIILIGSTEETQLGFDISAGYDSDRLLNWVGATQLKDVFLILAKAKCLIGCDSAPIHMASLTQTPTLNISFSTVNFWETGPRAYQSRVVLVEDEEELSSEWVARNASEIVNGIVSSNDVIQYLPGIPSFKTSTPWPGDFEWNLVEAIYMNKDFPENQDKNFFEGLRKVNEVNEIFLNQIEFIKKNGDVKKVAGIIDRCEEVIDTLAKIIPAMSPIVRWYQTEKIRIGPDNAQSILAQTEKIQNLLKKITDYYLSDNRSEEVGNNESSHIESN
jgi:ADP-heptose:LPS heptosyltransferase